MVCNLLQKIELLHAAGTHFTPPNAPEVVQSFYEILTMLDNKGLALLAFDGIIVAATTFAAEKGGVFSKRGLARWLAIVIIFMSLAAAAACLFVSEISYPFYGYVACNAAEQPGFHRRDSPARGPGRLAHRLFPFRLVLLDRRDPAVRLDVLGVVELDQAAHRTYGAPGAQGAVRAVRRVHRAGAKGLLKNRDPFSP